MYFNKIKTIYEKICSKHHIQWYKIESYFYDISNKGIRKRCPLLPLLFNIVLDILARDIRQEKETKGLQIGKEEVKLSLFMDDRIYKSPKDSSK